MLAWLSGMNDVSEQTICSNDDIVVVLVFVSSSSPQLLSHLKHLFALLIRQHCQMVVLHEHQADHHSLVADVVWSITFFLSKPFLAGDNLYSNRPVPVHCR